MDRRFLLYLYVFLPLIYIAIFFIAFGEKGLRESASNFISVAPLYLVFWFALALIIYVTWTTPRPKIVTVRRQI